MPEPLDSTRPMMAATEPAAEAGPMGDEELAGGAAIGGAAIGGAAAASLAASPFASDAGAWTGSASAGLGFPRSAAAGSGAAGSDDGSAGAATSSAVGGESADGQWSAAALGVSAASGAGADAWGSGGGSAGSGSGGAGGSWGGGSAGSGGSGGPGAGGSGNWGGGPREAAHSGSRPSRGRIGALVGIAAALIVLLGAGGVYYFSNASKASPDSNSSGKSTHVVSAPVKGPEQVQSITPADGSTDVNGGDAIKVVFSKPLSPSSPTPTLKPTIDGNWSVNGDTATFVPTAGIWQNTKVTVSIPAGATGVVSTAGGKLGTAVTDTFTTGKFSEVRLEQDLAQLGYLPATWAQTSGAAAPLTSLNAQYQAAYSPPQGSYTWQSGYPSELASLWSPNKPSQVLRGAVAAFQADHGLTEDMITENQDGLIVTGDIGHRLWKAMFKALSTGDMNKQGYTYAIASQHYPEYLTVWHNGKEIFHHLANTGIPESPTAVGTNPVYIRYVSQIMKGTNPDGSQYADQVYWVSYFHAGEAVHYFPRYSYGSQQSLGCVELPYSEAKWLWPYMHYGTLVTVTPT
ncbi:MAG TPA: Ig-like domain-containing protein [Streptosporangiaceae bacterium]|nr:Ig-like domain-containing protein [Streptosporangiaceae bacterium]